jgi:hypothetical protein
MSIQSFPMAHRSTEVVETQVVVFCDKCGSRYRVHMAGERGLGELVCDCGQKIIFRYGVAGAE